MKLNRKEPFGEIFGDTQGRRYEQGGKFFTVTGDEWADPAAPAAAGKKTADLKKPAADPAAAGDTQLDQQLNG
jgi:hypothetical protein